MLKAQKHPQAHGEETSIRTISFKKSMFVRSPNLILKENETEEVRHFLRESLSDETYRD